MPAMQARLLKALVGNLKGWPWLFQFYFLDSNLEVNGVSSPSPFEFIFDNIKFGE